MTWQEFAQQDPELAALGQERLDRKGLVMVAKLRKNGWPRISPVEPLFHNGQLYLGMMWRSRKALDLLRDPRCSIHNAVSDRMASEGRVQGLQPRSGHHGSRGAAKLPAGVISKDRRPAGRTRISLLRHGHRKRGGEHARRRKVRESGVEDPLA